MLWEVASMTRWVVVASTDPEAGREGKESLSHAKLHYPDIRSGIIVLTNDKENVTVGNVSCMLLASSNLRSPHSPHSSSAHSQSSQSSCHSREEKRGLPQSGVPVPKSQPRLGALACQISCHQATVCVIVGSLDERPTGLAFDLAQNGQQLSEWSRILRAQRLQTIFDRYDVRLVI
eukprot:GHVN01061175.1.p1 GENE.GHVN01061175.1~~GHVN01061175.1.p1  ORF type:complete len:176 (-),score=37.99 GHVN01061175.1:134-661(-)